MYKDFKPRELKRGKWCLWSETYQQALDLRSPRHTWGVGSRYWSECEGTPEQLKEAAKKREETLKQDQEDREYRRNPFVE